MTDSLPVRIFEDEHLVVFGKASSSSVLFITFAPIGAHGVEKPWGLDFVSKHGYQAVCFVSKRPNWYPASSVKSAIYGVNSFKSGMSVEKTICYGHSMGGYAALKYSGMLSADLVASFSPQISISPDDVSSYDNRYISYYNKPLMHDMCVVGGDIGSATALVFYDPLNKQDTGHYSRISYIKKIVGVRMTCMQHATIGFFSETKQGKSLLDILGSDVDGKDFLLRKLVRENRPNSESYKIGLESNLFLRAHSAALKNLSFFLSPTFESPSITLKRALSRIRQGNADVGVALLKKVSASNSLEPSLWKGLSTAYAEAGHHSEALASIRKADSLAGSNSKINNSKIVLQLAKACLKVGSVDEAVKAALRISINAEQDANVCRGLSTFWREAGDLKKSLEAISRAAFIMPADEGISAAVARIKDAYLKQESIVSPIPLRRSAVTNDPTLVFRVPSGHFFLQNDSCDVMGQHQRKVVFSAPVIAHWQQLLAERGRWLGQKNIPYYFLIAPDKQTVYWDELAKGMPDYRNALKIFEGAFENVSVIDPTQALMEARSGGDVYPHTDSHWDARGAYVAYNALIQAIKGEDVTLLVPGNHFQWVPHDSAGDLGCKLSPPVVSAHYRLRRQAMNAKAVFDNGMPANGRMRLWINPAATGKCLFFGDSFSYPIAQYLAEHFGLLLHVHGTHFDANLVSEFEPDQVVSEVTERFMVSAPMIEDHEPTELIYLRKMKRGDVAPEQVRQMRLTPSLDGLAAAACAPLYRRDQLILGAYCDRNVPLADYGAMDVSRAADVLAVAAHAQIARQVLPLAWQQCANDLNAVARDIVAGIGPRQ